MRNIWRIFMADLKCLRTNVIAGIVVVGLLLTPSLYAWFNILGFWDPYDETGNLEVAVANEDQGYHGELLPMKINAGEQVISELRGNDEFKWEFTSADEAVEGVKAGKYYAALVIPTDFSADLLTIFSGNVKHAEIEYYINQKENAVAPKVTERGADQLSTAINQEFTETIAEVGLGASTQLMNYVGGDGLAELVERLDQSLSDMVSDLRLAAEQAENFGELTDATAALSRSSSVILEQIGGASAKVRPILDQVDSGVNDGLAALQGATGVIDNGATGLQQGLGEAKTGVEQLLKKLEENGLLTNQQNPGEGAGSTGESDGESDAKLLTRQQIQEMLEKIAARISQTEETLAGLQGNYDQEMAEEIGRLKETLGRASGTMATLSGELDQMTGELDGAATSLAEGLTTAGDAMRRTADLLTGAADTLEGEREKLSLAMATGDLQKVREIIGGSPETLAQFIAAPTKLERIPVYGMANNGSAMTPFYTSLAIWVGSIFMVALMETEVGKRQLEKLESEAFGGAKSAVAKQGSNRGEKRSRKELRARKVTPAELYLGRYLIFLTFAILQATIVCFGDVFFLGVQCDNIGLFFLTGWVCALVFSLIVYTLTLSFSKVGESLAIILVVLQVASAGGIFPVVLSAPIFQAIYPWLPFVYSMNAFQGAMAGVYGDQFGVSILTLLAFTIPMLILGLILRRPVIRLNDMMLEKMEETGVM